MTLRATSLLLACVPLFCASMVRADDFQFRDHERVAFVGGSSAERMNLFGHFESLMHTRFPEKKLVVRNFGWPADEVGVQQRPSNYTRVDDPMEVFGPELFVCFFGFNEHFAGDSDADIKEFKATYRDWIKRYGEKYSKPGRMARFVLISPMAFEDANDRHLPDGKQDNQILQKYSDAIRELAKERGIPFVDVLTASNKKFSGEPGKQFTINGIHVNEDGDRMIASALDRGLFPDASPVSMDSSQFQQLKDAVNDKSWFHLQDYRMLNGWYVYGGRRTWDTKTFPGEYGKIRNMVATRDAYVHDIASGKAVLDVPDDTATGDVFIPETMFGTRDERFRTGREPKSLEYPTPEESIAKMKVPSDMEVQLFASEREFPELANPTQMMFDSKGRLWVSCMINYPQWLPGSAKPGDKLLIFEDTDNDGKADKVKTFYDGLICPTGFEFYEDGVLVVDEPRILFLRDTDGDDKADEVTHLIDGIATDDTHHTMGAWEWSHGGLLYMQEGVSMSTTLETPWGPFRNQGPSGSYVLDPMSQRFRYFKTPGYGNPWCMVFDRWGMGVIGDGTNAQQHWTSPLSGFNVPSRRTLRPVFDNQGMRPACGSDFLVSRHLPDSIQGQFIYACVINMHGLPRFEVGDEDNTAGYAGKRIENLIDSEDMFFRPIDPQIGPDGAVWFGDWCNALIGHMQYSQRDPNRDHEHGRIYRLVNRNKPLIKPELQAEATIPELMDQLQSYELRTRYRARRELRARPQADVLKAVDEWISGDASAEKLAEALWVQEGARSVDPALVARLMSSDNFHARSAAVHTVANEMLRFDSALDVFRQAIKDEHPRVRLEAIRALSFVQTYEALEIVLQVVDQPLDYWLEYTLEHTLQALKKFGEEADDQGELLANSSEAARKYYDFYILSSGPGGQAVKPLMIAQDEEAPASEKLQAVRELAGIRGGTAKKGEVVYSRVCASCHMIGDQGKAFGPKLDGVGSRYSKEQIIGHVLYPNETIAKGYETVLIITVQGKTFTGFILEEDNQQVVLGVATDDGKGKRISIEKDDIDEREELKASSMPEGLIKTIAPAEFLDLIEFLADQSGFVVQKDGWIETALADLGDLRRKGDFVEISRDSQLQLGSRFEMHHTKYAHLVLSAVDPNNREFAFHSPNAGSKDPAIAIRLKESSEIRAIEIQNRRNNQFYDRAKDMAVWISDDGQDWKQVWKSKKPAENYSIELPAGTSGRYIKIGLDGRGIFHLNQVVVYGRSQK